MIKTLPITQARADLPSLVDNAKRKMDEYVITVNGVPEAVLMSHDEYESLMETLDIMGDTELMKSIKEAEKELERGEGVDWEDVKKELNLNV